jgi:alpha-methylacyl-CoA racemase
VAQRQGPLAGIRIVELAGIGPGPFGAMLLADLGADVVQIDRPSGAAALYGIDPTSDLLNRGKRSVVLDLKSDADREATLALIDRADAVIESNRPGVAERLGVGPDVCLSRNPRLVYGRITGWGQDGPMAHWAGHDINYIALAGALHVCGRAGERPAIPQNFVGDMGGGGLLLAFGVLAAILKARSSGRGQVVDAAMVDGAAIQLSALLTMQAQGRFDERRGSHFGDGGSHFYEVYETADGKYLAVGAIEPQFYARFRAEAGLDDPDFDAQWDEARWPRLQQKVAGRIAEKTRDEWVALFSSESCVAPVLALSELDAHPHNAARTTFFRDRGILQPAPAPRFSRTPAQVSAPPAERGADTQAVLREWGVAAPAQTN